MVFGSGPGSTTCARPLAGVEFCPWTLASPTADLPGLLHSTSPVSPHRANRHQLWWPWSCQNARISPGCGRLHSTQCPGYDGRGLHITGDAEISLRMTGELTYTPRYPAISTHRPRSPRVLSSYVNVKIAIDGPYVILYFLFCQIQSSRTICVVTEVPSLRTANTLDLSPSSALNRSHLYNERICSFTNCITAVFP